MADGSDKVVVEEPTVDAASGSKASGSSKKKAPKAKKPPKQTREQSTIQFPYQDLSAGMALSLAIYGAGAVGVTREQLAGLVSMSPTSGGFLLKVATARMFGLITLNAQGEYELTNLGHAILQSDEKKQRVAQAEAFLNVPLYKRVYEEFRGKSLPPRPLGLEQAFIKFGVAPKQKVVARQVFDRSARQAGYFAAGEDRLIPPIIGAGVGQTVERAVQQDGVSEAESNGPVGSTMKGLHPFVQGLLASLPEPGTNWAVEGRAKWLQAAAHNFDLMYKGSGTITITPKDSETPPAAAFEQGGRVGKQ